MRSGSREDIGRVVEKQMRNWELACAQRHQEATADQPQVAEFIAISRMVGVGGSAVAAALGEKLGWPVWDRRILDVMAGNDDLRRRIYGSMDERDLDWLEEALRATGQPEFVRNDYFHVLRKTVLSLARQTGAIFLGRGADQILPRNSGLRVRLVAPLDWRIRQFADRAKLSATEASYEVRRIDRERNEFVWRHFGISADDPIRYDLTLNLASIAHDGVVELIRSAHAAVAERHARG